MSDFVYPEDQGTNANLTTAGEGDDADAANFASAFEAIGNRDFVVRGMSIENVSGGTYDLTPGKAVVSDESADAAQSGEERTQQVSYVVETGAKSGLEYTEGEENFIYLDVLLTDDDALEIISNTTDTQPDQPSLKIAKIDDTT